MDIKTTYLNSPIAEEIYMKQPKGFEQLDNKGKPLICLMKKSLYGLKQSGRNWYQTFRNFLVAKGIESSVHNNCLFIKKSERQLQGAVFLWVDDIISCEFQENFSSWIESEVSQDFKISDCRDLCSFLGMKFVKKENSIEINQEQYIQKLFERFGLESCKSVETPLAEIKLTREDCPQEGSEEQERIKNFDFRNLVGCLNYLACSSRPDIAFAANFLISFVENPGEKHWKAGKRVLRYLKGSKSKSLVFRRGDKLTLECYSDADWAGNLEHRKSTSG